MLKASSLSLVGALLTAGFLVVEGVEGAGLLFAGVTGVVGVFGEVEAGVFD
jgi:hypothetical protein